MLLPKKHRIVDRVDYQRVQKAGRRVGGDWFVLVARDGSMGPTRFGFITPKSLGSAIVRNRIRRRLRHLAAGTVATHPEGWDVVVRVTADCSHVGTDQLSAEWQRCLSRAGVV